MPKQTRHPMRAKLVSSDEAIDARGQHTKPCGDCPWARTALPGWLGGSTPEEWIACAHSHARIECHTARGAQCAGAAIYRRNVVQRADFTLPADRERVFAMPQEFIAYHSGKARE